MKVQSNQERFPNRFPSLSVPQIRKMADEIKQDAKDLWGEWEKYGKLSYKMEAIYLFRLFQKLLTEFHRRESKRKTSPHLYN